MEIEIKGKKIDVGNALTGHMRENLLSGVTKYFANPVDGSVLLAKDAHLFRCDILVHVGKDIEVQGRAAADDAYAAFDSALERITKQLRRYKRRLRDHHKERNPAAHPLAQHYVIASEDDDHAEEPDGGQPAIVAEIATKIETLTVGEAVMRMDLADVPTLMFHNSAHGGLNVVYRREDGNIGWIDPSLTK